VTTLKEILQSRKKDELYNPNFSIDCLDYILLLENIILKQDEALTLCLNYDEQELVPEIQATILKMLQPEINQVDEATDKNWRDRYGSYE
jgi:hypothetical protein